VAEYINARTLHPGIRPSSGWSSIRTPRFIPRKVCSTCGSRGARPVAARSSANPSATSWT